METQALRLLIHQKLSDGRLPRHGVPRVGGTRGDGQRCHACEALVAKSEFVMEALLLGHGRIRAAVSFHVHCFHIWDDERQRLRRSAASGTDRDRDSGVETYKEHTIVTAATEERAMAWSVLVTVLDAKDVIVMPPCDLGGGAVTFGTKALANEAGVLFGRVWIDRRDGS